MAALLYLIVAIATLAAWHRFVTPLTRRAAIIIFALPFLFTGWALATNRVFGGYDILFLCKPYADYAKDFGWDHAHNWNLTDHVLQFAPWQHAVCTAWAHHEWPLWNPAMDSGEILAANMQSAPLNPLNLIALLLPLDLATAFNATMVFFLAALFAFAFARELGCSEPASLIASAGYATSSAMAFHVGWPHALAWTTLPFVFLAVRRARFALLTIALTFLVLIGHPETLFHIVVLGAIYALFEYREWRKYAIAIASGATTAALTAIVTLPFLAALGETWEVRARKALALHPPYVITHDIWKALLSTFIPYFGGASWWTPSQWWDFGTARVGSVVLCLAVIATFRLWRRREVRFFTVLCAITLLICWKVRPVTAVLRHIPGFDVALNDRLGFASALCLSLLAAFAFDARDAVRDRRIVIVVGTILMIATAALTPLRLHAGVDRRLVIIGAVAELFGIIVLLLNKRTFALILIAIAAQRFVEDTNIHPTIPRSWFYPSTPLIAKIPRDPLFRVTAISNYFAPNVATMYGLEDIRGYSATTYFPYLLTTPLWCPTSTRGYHEVNDLSLPFLNFLGVRHALTPLDMNPPDGWRVVADDRNTRLMENTRAIPRVFVPRHIRFIDNHQFTLDEMSHATDFADVAWIYSRDTPPHDEDNGSATLDVHRVGSRYEIDANVTNGARVILSEASWPGWRAYIDGHRVKLDRANRAFLGLFVPQGKHHIRVVYLPDAFVEGRAISLAALFALILYKLFANAIRNRRSTLGTRLHDHA